MFGSNNNRGGSNQNQNQNQQCIDIDTNQLPSDSISCLKFNPKAYYIACGSWDGDVRIWEINSNGQYIPKHQAKLESPILCNAWSGDGSKLFVGGASNTANMIDLNSQSAPSVVAQHEGPIRTMGFLPGPNLLCTGSWDKTIKYWDLRSPTPALSVQLPERVFAMDTRFPEIVVATANGVFRFDLNMPDKPKNSYPLGQHPLQFQVRSLGIFIDGSGMAIGSIAGRVAIVNFDPAKSKSDFTFKCHRDQRTPAAGVFSVNSISFHPVFNTFATGGSDGAWNFWDKDSRTRLSKSPKAQAMSISCTDFSHDGRLFASVSSYEWNKGCDAYDPKRPQNIVQIYAVTEDQVRPKNPQQQQQGSQRFS